MARLPLLAATAAAALVLPAAAAATSAPPPADCPLWAPHARVEHPIPGTKLVARDPYGGLLARNRLFFSFSVRGPRADLANVASVTWALDGVVKRTDDRAPFQWSAQSGSSKRMPAGDHTITVSVTPRGGGAPATTSFALTATDCQPAGFFPDVPKARGASLFNFQSAIERGGGPDLTKVAVTSSSNVKASLPRALRGRRIGALVLLGDNGRRIKTYTLKGYAAALARDGIRVQLTPGARAFLRVTGLPTGVKQVQVRLVSGIAALRTPRKAFRVTGTVYAGHAHASVTGGGSYA
ncbi:MAG TPA: hypothetical protein VFG42_18110 [Baekduia sp.]|uniref:hypothetical protein n=1 Tax=Baekduia sp. TaxID=2600305 RepID=UPI002D77ECC1|nr:hypothetical protein [Baekduia sp.]HET6508714.1 hypothetical protein [Baekduia sp.]